MSCSPSASGWTRTSVLRCWGFSPIWTAWTASRRWTTTPSSSIWTTPNIGVPEHLFHYPAVILHRDFEGDIVKQPVGTGAFLLEEYAEGERAVFKRRPDYWRMGEDGEPLPYLDEIIYVSIDKDAAVAALQSGQVDSMFQPRPSDWQALKDVPGITVRDASTSQCFLTRMRVDLEPWDDNRVRTALKMCQDRDKILQLSYYGQGDLSIDAHVAPVHPGVCGEADSRVRSGRRQALLEEYAAEKGIELPLKVTLATKNDQSEPEIAAGAQGTGRAGRLRHHAGHHRAGRLLGSLDRGGPGHHVLDAPPSGHDGPAAGLHRRRGRQPGTWNETRWVDDEFTEKLREAEKTLDVEARREIMSDIEDIMQERGPIANPYWKKGVEHHPLRVPERGGPSHRLRSAVRGMEEHQLTSAASAVVDACADLATGSTAQFIGHARRAVMACIIIGLDDSTRSPRSMTVMARFLIRSLVSTVVTMLLVSMLLFVLLEIGTGDITVKILGVFSTPEQRESFANQLGLDAPAYQALSGLADRQ